GPSFLAVGDVNGDNVPDFAVACSGSDSVAVVLGRTGGQGNTFGNTSFIHVGSRPVAIAMGDVDGDGVRDLAVANAGDNTVSILRGAGTGAFTPLAVLPTESSPGGVALQDVNGDGKLDLIVTNNRTNTVGIWTNNGSGAFVLLRTIPTGTGPR